MQRDPVGKQQQSVVRKGQVCIALPASQLPVNGRQRCVCRAQHTRKAGIALVLQRTLVLLQPVLPS